MYQIATSGRIIGYENLKAETDDEAMITAARIARHREWAGYELWQETRLVWRHVPET
jgi:hypothetical protein